MLVLFSLYQCLSNSVFLFLIPFSGRGENVEATRWIDPVKNDYRLMSYWMSAINQPDGGKKETKCTLARPFVFYNFIKGRRCFI